MQNKLKQLIGRIRLNRFKRKHPEEYRRLVEAQERNIRMRQYLNKARGMESRLHPGWVRVWDIAAVADVTPERIAEVAKKIDAVGRRFSRDEGLFYTSPSTAGIFFYLDS